MTWIIFGTKKKFLSKKVLICRLGPFGFNRNVIDVLLYLGGQSPKGLFSKWGAESSASFKLV